MRDELFGCRLVFLFACAPLLFACSGDNGRQDAAPADAADLAGPETGLFVPEVSGEASGQPEVRREVVVEPPPESVELSDEQGNSVVISTAPLGIVGRKGDEVVWDGSEMPLMIGFVDKHDPNMRYDPDMIADEVQWTGFENLVQYSIQEGNVHCFEYEPLPGRSFSVRAYAAGKGIVTIEVAPVEFDGEVLTQIAYGSKEPSENFYGLGESFDHVARRGTHRHMHLTLDLKQESGYNEAHFPVPLLISTKGSGIFVEDRHPGLFDVCKTDPERVTVRFSTPELKFHLLFADTPLQVLSRYVELAGKPALPPQWAFGIVQWQDEVDGQAMVMEDALSMRELDLPCSGIWIDRPFATAHESFVFDPDAYPDSEKMIEQLNGLGYRVAIWSAPYLSEDLAEEYALAEQNGYFVDSPDIMFEKFGKLVDFTNPGLVQLWQSLISNATGIGIEGFKLDYGEDVISGFGSVKTTFHFHNGEGSDTMHHWYHYFYHKTYRDMLEGDAFLINRAGCYGDQTITSVCWPGDLCNNFKYHGEDGHVGGLPAAMVGNQALSVSGYPFFGSDTGGYRHFRPSKEVLLRWVQHTALSPVLQFGGAGENCNPWDFTHYEGEDDGTHYVSQYDEETVEIWRKYARLHIRLFPYVYTYAVNARETGVPITRPYGMVHPEQNLHPDFEYFYGDFFVVAPVHRAAEEIEVLVPPGTWIDWFDREVHEGPAEKTFDAPLDKLVLLVRQGAIIPMLRESVDTLAPVSDPEVDSYANDPGTLVVRVFPGAEQTSFATVLGPKFAVSPKGDGYDVQYESVTPGFKGVLFEVDCMNLPSGPLVEPALFDSDGSQLAEAGSADEVKGCSGCYYFNDSDKLLHVSPSTASGSFEFH